MTIPLGAVIATDAAVWLTVQVGAGYAVHRLPDRLLDADIRILREHPWERGGRFYRDRLAVARWKHHLPEGGAVFRGGVDKRTLPSGRTGDLERFWRETRRAELGHWLAIAGLAVFPLWNPPFLWPAMALYAVAVNTPCIVAQRYNRLRLSRVLAARSRNSRGTNGSSMP